MLMFASGVLLRRLQIESDLDNVSHVFVDEVVNQLSWSMSH